MTDIPTGINGLDHIVPLADRRAMEFATEAAKYGDISFVVELLVNEATELDEVLAEIGDDPGIIVEEAEECKIRITTALRWHGFGGGPNGLHHFESPFSGRHFMIADHLLDSMVHIDAPISTDEDQAPPTTEKPKHRHLRIVSDPDVD